MGNILDPRCVVCADPYMVHKPSDNLKASSDSEQSTNASNYAKLKEIVVADYAPKINDKDVGKFRIKFDLATDNSSVVVYGRIYKNGNAVGTARSTQSTTYVTFTEDLEFKAGDKIQLYAHSDGSKLVKVRNFRVYADGICLSCGYDDSQRQKHSWS